MDPTKTALITGASSGIGLELAKIFAKEKYDLVLVARNANKLDELANELKANSQTEITNIPKDLSVPGSPEEIFNIVTNKGIEINFLVNNAGYGGSGYFAETDLDLDLNMMQVNMNSLVSLTRLFLPQMIKRKFGKIMNVASTAAFAPGPLMSIYYATKAFVLSFSEALANELIGTGVTVTVLCPGPTETGFQKRASVEKTRLVSFQKVHNAKVVAEMGFKAMMKGKTIIIPDLQNKLLIQSIRISPRKVVSSITRWLQESKKK